MLKIVIHPGFGNYSGTIPGADLFLISLDQEIDGRRIDIPLLKQNGLKRTDPQFRFRQVGMFVIVRHETSLADPGYAGKVPIPVPIPLSKFRQAGAPGQECAKDGHSLPVDLYEPTSP